MKRSAGFLLLALTLFTGCHKRTPVTALPPATPAAPVPAPVANAPLTTPAIPVTPPPAPQPAAPAVNPLDQADAAFNAGNYGEAARFYDTYVQRQPKGDRRDQALFRQALSYALISTPAPDWTKITAILKQLIDQYPQSPLKPSAAVILSLAADTQKRDQRIKLLTTELDKLKQADADRRKRP